MTQTAARPVRRSRRSCSRPRSKPGYSPNDIVSGGSLDWRAVRPVRTRQLEPGGCRSGTMSLTTAIADSNNCAFARTLLSLGPGALRRATAPDASSTWPAGSASTRPRSARTRRWRSARRSTNVLDMAEAFSVFANDGVHRDAELRHQDRRPRRQGPLPGRHHRDPRPVRAERARPRRQMLTRRDHRRHGDWRRASTVRPPARPARRTDRHDAWFVGYTPQYTTAVWMGDWSGAGRRCATSTASPSPVALTRPRSGPRS